MRYVSDKENRRLIIKVIASLLLGMIISFFNNVLGYTIAMLLILTSVFMFIKKREDRINDLNQYLKKLNQGDYRYDIESYEEGELAKLQSELNKTTILLQNMNIELTDQKDLLQKALEDIAHQLKTPISSLLLINELQEKDELVIKSKDQLERLNYLSDSLLKLIKLDAGLEIFNKSEVPLLNVFDKVRRLMSPRLANLSLDFSSDDLMVNIDEDKFKESLLNVLNNKLRYAKEVITVEVKEDTFFTYIEVSDDGDSISSKDKIFNRFYSGKKKDSQSIGIGLSIAQEYMVKQDCDLYVKGENTFVFKIPKI